jgi:hypothetical protein
MIPAHSNPIRPMPAAGFIASVLGIGQDNRPATVTITKNQRSAV